MAEATQAAQTKTVGELLGVGVTGQASNKTVTMVFPRQMRLRESHHLVHTFKQGVNEVAIHLADHPYLAANGVHKYVVPKAAPHAPAEVEEGAAQETTGEAPVTTEIENTGEDTPVIEEVAKAPNKNGGKKKGKK